MGQRMNRTWSKWIAAFLIIIFSWLLLQRIYGFLFQNPYPPGYDARSYIAAATALRYGLDPYDGSSTSLEKIANYSFSQYLYPPFLAVLLIPLSLLPIISASYFCVALAFLSAIFFFILLRQTLGWKTAFLAVFIFPPTWQTIYLGQVNFFVAALLLLSIYAIQSNHEVKLGTYLFLGILLKITPLVSTMVLFLQGYKRSIIAGLITVLIIVLVMLPVTSLNLWIKGSFHAILVLAHTPYFASWTGLLTYYFPRYGDIVSWILSGVIILYTALRIKKISAVMALSATIIVPLLIARIIWEHHSVMALPALAILTKQSQGSRILAIFSWLMIAAFGWKLMPWVLTLCWIVCCWPNIILRLETWLDRSSMSKRQIESL
ncbi:MAG TPA: glycosyltransferase family 87 protein [Anaerolineales bacterium]|nr:glycosyltransferase family 87 protein [Anaerolineales bacterium]